MSDLVVIEFPSEAKAEDVRQRLLDMQKEEEALRAALAAAAATQLKVEDHAADAA